MEFIRIVEIVLLAGILIFVIVFFPIIMVGSYGNWLRLLKKEAEKRNGEYVTEFNCGLRHFLKIPFDGGTVTLGDANIRWKQSGPPCIKTAGFPSSIKFNITNRRFIQIFTNMEIPQLKDIFHGRDIHLGNTAFDQSFVVLGSNEGVIRHLLTDDIQQKMLKMNRYDMYLSLQDGNLRYISCRFKWDEERLDEYLDMGLAVIQQLKRAIGKQA